MNKLFKYSILILTVAMLIVSCKKKPLTLDEQTSMKTLLKADDEEIKNLVLKEVEERSELTAEAVDIEYILRDEESQAIAVKLKIKEQ